MIVWTHWHNEPLLIGTLAVVAWAYALAIGPWRFRLAPHTSFPRGAATCFAGALLVFYLAVLPQFIGPATPWTALLALAVTHALLSLSYLMLVVAGLHRVRRVLHRRPVRRALDALTGAVLLGFGTRLALDRA